MWVPLSRTSRLSLFLSLLREIPCPSVIWELFVIRVVWGGRLDARCTTRVYGGLARFVAEEVMWDVEPVLTKLVRARSQDLFLAVLFGRLLVSALTGSRSPRFLHVLGLQRGKGHDARLISSSAAKPLVTLGLGSTKILYVHTSRDSPRRSGARSTTAP